MARRDSNTHALVRRICRRMMAFGKTESRWGRPGQPCLRKHYAFLRSRQNARAYHPRHPEFITRDSARDNSFLARVSDYYFPKLWINRYVSIDYYRRAERRVEQT